MASLTHSVRIEAPRERVFEVFADLPNVASRVKGIVRLEVLTEGPVGKGTRFRETRVMFGKEATETMEITAFDPPRSYSAEATSCGTHYVAKHDFRSAGSATVVDLTFTATPTTLIGKAVGALMAKMMMNACRKAVEKDFADLKRHIEHPAAPGASPAP